MNDISYFSKRDLIEELENRGFNINNIRLDDTDQHLLDDILAVFEASNWAERKEIRDKICGKN